MLPYRGAPQSVDVIRRSALDSQRSYELRSLAEAICSGLPSKDYVGEYLAFHNFVWSHCRYMRDPRTVELIRSPKQIAKTLWKGAVPSLDCDDMAGLLSAFTLSAGGQTDLVTVAFRNMFYNGKRQYSHVFARARDPRTGTFIVLDPVAGSVQAPGMLSRVVAYKIWPIA